MTLDLETRIRRAAEVLDRESGAQMTAKQTTVDLQRSPSQPRRRWMAAAAAAVLLVGGAAAVIAVTGDPENTPSTVPVTEVTPPPTEAPTTTPTSGVFQEGWNALSEAPISARFMHHTVPTEHGVLFWGQPAANSGSLRPDVGAFLDMTTGQWIRTPRAPAPSAGTDGDETSVGVGDEAIFLVEVSGELASFSYDATSNRWRSIPEPPPTIWPGSLLKAFAVGDKAIFVRSGRLADSADGEVRMAGSVAIFDTATRTWSEGTAPPDDLVTPQEGEYTIWGTPAGDRLVIAGLTARDDDVCSTNLFIYDPASDEWDDLLSESDPAAPMNAGLTFTGTELFTANYTDCRVFASPGQPVTEPGAQLLGLDGGARRTVDAPMFVSSLQGWWTGRAVATTGDRGDPLFYDPTADAWHAAPLDTEVSGLQLDTQRDYVYVDGAMVTWGGTRTPAGEEPTPEQAVADGYVYVPPAEFAE